MMLGTNHNSADRDCPSLLELAAYADACLDEEAKVRLEAHVAQCESCMQLLYDLAVEVPHIQSEARMLIVPGATLRAAMNLRAGDAQQSPVPHVHPAAPRWVIGARRGLAAAAAVGIVLGGYQIGQTFTAATADSVAGDAASSEVFAFGLFESSSLDDSNDLFAMAFPETAGANEATP
jgi:hypothetical protein